MVRLVQFFLMRSGAPHKSGENREAGENPARSRHCESLHYLPVKESQETCLNVQQLLNAREKVFRPQWEISF
jgi:hypothetical protein